MYYDTGFCFFSHDNLLHYNKYMIRQPDAQPSWYNQLMAATIETWNLWPLWLQSTYINDYDEPAMNWGNFISGFRLPNYLSKVTMANKIYQML